MCEAQCASIRSRLERRVNRVPTNKRKIKLIEVLEPAPAPQKLAQVRKEKEPAPAPALNPRRTRPVPAAAAAPAFKTTAKVVRGVKRTSDDISAEDKENNAELTIPKKRAKAVPAPARATRTTRAASKKVDPAPQVLSPKTNNSRPAPRTRTQRQR